MKKTIVALGSILVLLLGACSQIPGFTPTPGTGPTADTAGTATALFNTAVAESLTAQPTLTTVPPTDTATLPVAPLDTFTPEPPTQTFTLPPDLTTTPATATAGTANATVSATLAPGQVTPSPTLGIRTYGTLPPAVPSSRITLINRSKREAYISLQVTMNDGKFSILEYPVRTMVKVQAPVGWYVYVAWVGGNKMVGEFRLIGSDDISITLYKDRVVIK